jgi:hypothetical protein
MHQRPLFDPDPDNLMSTHSSSAPPPYDYPPSVCPNEPLPGLTLPQPGNTLRLPSTRATVERHTPTPLTPHDLDQPNSEQSLTTPPSSRRAGTTHAGVFLTPRGRYPLQDLTALSTTALPQSRRIRPSLSTRRPRRFPTSSSKPTHTSLLSPPPPRCHSPTTSTFVAVTRD